MKKFSVIVPDTDSINMEKNLEALHHQTFNLSDGEVLVVGSDKPGQVMNDEYVRFIPTDAQHSSAWEKRNLGMEMAQGYIFLFLDDDCVPNPEWIELHLSRHMQGEKIVGGAITFGRGNYWQLADNLSAFHDLLPYTLEGPRTYLSAANLSVERSVVQEVGIMAAQLRRAEDLDWTVRMREKGFRLYFEPKAVVYHDPDRRSFASFVRHWVIDAPDTLRIRLRHARLLNTPKLARYRKMYLWGSPFVAAWATLRTFAHPLTLLQYWDTMPLVYLSKLLWCWSAYHNFPSQSKAELDAYDKIFGKDS
jgi:glycosyltransferase involved in cell wall biosynthesis